MMSEDQVAKLILTSDRVKLENNDIYITSYAKYNAGGVAVMAQECPICGIEHDEPFRYENNNVAQIVCPKTGVKIYAIYA